MTAGLLLSIIALVAAFALGAIAVFWLIRKAAEATIARSMW